MPKPLKKNLPDTPETPPINPEPVPESIEQPEAPEPETADAQPAEPEKAVEQKRGPGRPKTDPNAEEKTAWTFIQGIPSWEGVYAYLFREQPYTNALMGGQRFIHVKRYDAPFDSEDVLAYAGSGVYQIQISQRQPGGKEWKKILHTTVRLLDYNRPPKIPPGAWIDDPRNKEWEWAKEFIFPKKEEVPKIDPAFSLMEKQMERAYEEMKALRAQMTDKDSQVHPLVALFAPFVPAIVAKITEKPAAPPTPADPMASLATAVQLIKSMQPAAPPAPAPSPFEAIAMKLVEGRITGTEKSDFEKFLEFKEKFDAAAPPERRGKKDGWDHAVDMVEALQLGPALAPFAQIIAMKMMQQQNAPPQQQQHAPPPQHAPQMPPPGTPEPQQQAPPPSPRPQAVPDQPSVPVFAKAVLEHLQKDWSGLDLGDWYLKRYGMKEFEDIRKQGKDEVLTLLKSVPESFAPLESFHAAGKLEPMIEEFLDWEPEPQQAAGPQQAPIIPQSSGVPISDGREANKPNWNNPAVGVEVQQ